MRRATEVNIITVLSSVGLASFAASWIFFLLGEISGKAGNHETAAKYNIAWALLCFGVPFIATFSFAIIHVCCKTESENSSANASTPLLTTQPPLASPLVIPPPSGFFSTRTVTAATQTTTEAEVQMDPEAPASRPRDVQVGRPLPSSV